MRTALIAAVITLGTIAGAAGYCGVPQTQRLDLDMQFCLNDAHWQDGLYAAVKNNNDTQAAMIFHDCQQNQQNGQNNIDNGLDCDREHPGIYLAMVRAHCPPGRC
jgi:hypothetical protein